MAGYHVGRRVKRNLRSYLIALPSMVDKRLFCAYTAYFICPFHQKAIRRSLSNQKNILYDCGTYEGSNKMAVKFQPSRRLFQVPGILNSSKRKEYSNRKLIGFSMENLYHVVSHVEDYKYFVPWCRDSTVFEREGGHVKCKLEIGFPPLVERYISVLTLVPPNLVVSECTQGELFNYMKTVWRFSPGLKGDSQTAMIDLHVAFEFRSVLHSHLSSVFFDEVVKKMVYAFEKRCEKLYGPSSLTKSRGKRTLRSKAVNTIEAPPR
ncbi:coenzyme Q-binding protein COQ10 homolog B, mitochondrial-like isoform X2 [Dendronephthya gigantea]|uniref:coenzyme Q-binding protein COQ10 homolog B, mitochondrial-like isoform X2 n=1 Tax=Dendronephthya gigantea TaxID=151771 RepID=UPI00106AD3E2|nr:coenzyme Q-binding protein COQ10 homolog B, mitochondrial-like isoform X2 [Dendronephthya gigantea]